MESWNFVSGNKVFTSGESSARDKSDYPGWVLRGPASYGNTFGITNVEGIQNQGFGEVGMEETIRKPWDVSRSVTICNSNSQVVANRFYTPVASSAVSVYSGNEPTSVFSSSVVQSNNKDMSLIDLKLGRLSDKKDKLNCSSSKVVNVGSSVESSSTPPKRTRATLTSQAAFCQVHGCQKDLTDCKDYHKRHKVCEIHSKTAKVIVSGIEQRFCQQCSRFHLLGEFDDGKRSCRKRLAGHNERRRKAPSGRPGTQAGKIFQSYYGSMVSNPQGLTLSNSSISSQDPSGLTFPFRYNPTGWNMQKNPEEGGSISHYSEITNGHGYQNPKSTLSHSLSRNVPPFHFNEVSSSSGRDMSEPSNKNHQNFMLFDSSPEVRGAQGILPAGRALSLLSSQSATATNTSSEFLLPYSSASGLANKFRAPSGLLAFDGGNNLGFNNFMNYDDGFFQGSEYSTISKGRIFGDQGLATIDLLQLSSQLQRVEHEREYSGPNQDNDAIP